MESEVGQAQWILGQSPGSNSVVIWPESGGAGWPGNPGNLSSTGNVGWTDLIGHWSRIEVCMYGGLNNDNAGDPVTFEAYLERVDNPSIRKEWNATLGNPGGTGTGGGLGDMPVSHYMQDCANPYGYVSHFMMAEWDTDSPGTFIGAAYEVQDGSSVPPPPPPANDPPPPASDPPPPANDPPPPGAALDVQTSVANDTATVSATWSGAGPYQFLFDCGLDGNWNGIVNTASASAQHACPMSGQTALDVKVWAWDQGTGAISENIVTAASEPQPPPLIGRPGQPQLVLP
jgi:hypothetical protein